MNNSKMNNQSINPTNNRLIKSWFGFSVGGISVALSLLGISEQPTLSGILSTLGFLCFWYPWSQMTHWKKPIKSFFKEDDQTMSKPCIYLTMIATILLITSTVIRFIN